MFDVWVGVVAVVAGAIAAISGFGIGSLLTPLLAVHVGAKLAIAVVSIPHLVATSYRFWILRKHVDRGTLIRFGSTSAVGGLVGALVHAYAASPSLALVFGAILVFVGVMGLTGLAKRMHFHGWLAWLAGGLSGLLGGLVGNQGGIRSAALLGFSVPKEAFVATATAIGLIVDAARMPIYLTTQWHAVRLLWPLELIAVGGVWIGTMGGARLLRCIPERTFGRVVSGLVLVLGAYMLSQVRR